MNLFRTLKSRLHIDNKLFKKAKYEALKLIKTKYVGVPNRTLISNINARVRIMTLRLMTHNQSLEF